MLSEIFQPFVKESPISVMVGGLLARVFCPDEIDHLFEVNAQRQYTKTLLFSTLFDLMSKVVCGIRYMRLIKRHPKRLPSLSRRFTTS